MQLQSTNNYYGIYYDLMNKNVSKNFYKCNEKKKIKVNLSSNILIQLQKLSNKKLNSSLKILILYYFLFSSKPFVKSIVMKHKSKGKLVFENMLSFKKITLLQLVNITDFTFSKNFYYTFFFSFLVKQIFLYFFNYKKKNLFIFKIIKI